MKLFEYLASLLTVVSGEMTFCKLSKQNVNITSLAIAIFTRYVRILVIKVYFVVSG